VISCISTFTARVHVEVLDGAMLMQQLQPLLMYMLRLLHGFPTALQ
jgi:hypothetical protein